jgi:DNA-binding transcriptional LysR family regulator
MTLKTIFNTPRIKMLVRTEELRNGFAVKVYLHHMQSTDMNLLLALDVLLREESVTVAGEKMGLSAPAMSRTLLRARKLMGDPILVRAGKRLVPTPKALELKVRIQALADEARSIVRSGTATSLADMERVFTIRADESFAGAFAMRIMERLNKKAPHMKLRFLGRVDEGVEALREGNVDLDIGASTMPGPELKVQMLHRVKFVGAVRAGHVLAREKITAAKFAAQKHIAAGRRGKPRGPIDFELEKMGLSRTIALWVPSFFPAMVAAATSDLVAAVPQYFTSSAVSLFGLHVFRIPLKLDPVTVLQVWHPRFDADPAHRLLRDCVRRACQEKESQLADK